MRFFCCCGTDREVFAYPAVKAKFTIKPTELVNISRVNIYWKNKKQYSVVIDSNLVAELKGILVRLQQAPASEVGRGIRGDLIDFFYYKLVTPLNEEVAKTIADIYGKVELLPTDHRSIRLSSRAVSPLAVLPSFLTGTSPPDSPSDLTTVGLTASHRSDDDGAGINLRVLSTLPK